MFELFQGLLTPHLVKEAAVSYSCLWSQSGVECVQRTNAKTRNRKKPAAELQQKLALCERLLEQLSEVGLPQSATSSTPSSGNGRGERQTAPLEVSLGKLVIDKGSVRFTDNLLWATLFDEVSHF